MEEYAVQVDDIEEERYTKHPLVGEEYQAKLPPLMSQSDYNCFQKHHEVQVGSPVPIFWINDDNSLINGREVQNETNIENEMVAKKKRKGLVPGSSNDTNWNETEEASLTLGLHIFGKNLVQLKEFIGNNKTTGDILVFYYTKFYESKNHQRWRQYRKMNTSRGVRKKVKVYKQNIFTRKSHQELLSRLLRNVQEECHRKLLEVSKKFVSGRIPLEDYVFTLKALVGINTLIEAVGLGKENDLTMVTLKYTHANPIGKDCAKLTPGEIIHYLTGDFRLSKSRANDLFWKAVWPRLQAKGWSSEQPASKNDTFSSNTQFFFIVPGVENFSKKLVKGIHYFDSISDVLTKVASHPELIEDETVAGNNTKEAKLGHEDSPQQQRHSHLKHPTPDFNTEGTGLTIMDTLVSKKCKKSTEPLSVPTASFGTKDQGEKPQPRINIDLNLPYLPKLEVDDPMETEVGVEQQNKLI